MKRSEFIDLMDMSALAAQSLSELADTILEQQCGGIALEMLEQNPKHIAWNFTGELTQAQVLGLLQLAKSGKIPLQMLFELYDAAQNYLIDDSVAAAFIACEDEQMKKELVAYAVCDCESLLPHFVDYVTEMSDASTMHYALVQSSVAKFGEASEAVQSLLMKMHKRLSEDDYAGITAWLSKPSRRRR